jgi:hypothetical protein
MIIRERETLAFVEKAAFAEFASAFDVRFRNIDAPCFVAGLGETADDLPYPTTYVERSAAGGVGL